MIFVIGSPELKATLGNFDHAVDPDQAKCMVVEVPGYLSELDKFKDLPIPVVFVATGMINLNEWRFVKEFDIETLDSISGTLENHFRTQESSNTEAAGEDIEFIYEEQEDTPVEQLPQEETPHHTTSVRRPRQNDIFAQHNSNRGNIAAFFSASGGVGKTFTSINVSGAAAINGINTVAIDLDFGYGDLDTATGLVDPGQRNRIVDKKAVVPKNGWATVPEWRRFARNLKGNMLRHNSGLYVMPSYPYIGNDIPGTEIEDLILTLAEQFDLVAIDLGVDAFSPHASTALRLADSVFLIGGQDEKTIGKLTQFLNSDYAQKEKTKLVINMVQPTGYYSPKEICKKLGFNEFSEIPLDQQGVNAAKKAHKLAVQLNGSAAGEAVKDIAGKHLPFGLDYNQQPAKKSLFSKIGFLRRG